MTPPCRILLVDDEQDIVELIQLRLEAQGYAIATAPDGLQALRVMEHFQPQLILCDVVMPVMDGPAFCRKLRSENNRVPFIFLTAKGQPQDIVGLLSAGADDYVVKPFDPGELLARIKTNLRRG